MGLRLFLGLLVISLAGCASRALPPSGVSFDNPMLRVSNATQIFDDEFNGTSLNAKIWYTCYPWAAPGQGCTNNPGHELEWYEAPNVAVSGGFLTLTAIAKTANNLPYTSGMVSTGGTPTTQATFSFLYGYAESRIKLPPGTGMWPAFWMVPADRSWPPEIDIMEWQGVFPKYDFCTIHWGTAKNPQQNGSAVNTGIDLSSGYHTYAVDWERSYVNWYFDGRLIKRYTNATNIPHKPMYVILNLAIGGWAPGQLNPLPTSFPAVMSVDYLRIWNRKP